jgi:acyl-CoA synthetase (AMP-forming)/AMP-acid ligase II
MASVIDNEICNVAHFLVKWAEQTPHNRAVIYGNGKDRNGKQKYAHLTFQELDRESDCYAHGLVRAGITRGTRTILMVKPSLEFFCLVFAMFKVGAVPVVVDPGMGIPRMLRCLQEGRPQAFIGISQAHVLRKISPKFFKSVKVWVTVGRRWFWGGLNLESLKATPWEPFPLAETHRNETAAILFTTGSTGPAKGAVYTHGIFDAQIQRVARTWGISPGEIDLPTFPLFALFDPALGMAAVIPDMDPTKPAHVNPDNIIKPIMELGITNMFASPALLNRVGRYGKEKGLKLPSLKRVISAGAPVTPLNIETFSSMLSDEAEVHTPYGATEAVPAVTIGSKEILNETKALTEQGWGMCVGRPIDGITLRIIKITDDPIPKWSDDLIMPDGEIGELTAKGEWVTRHYFERADADALAKIKDGDDVWHRMGDVGWIDDQGRIWFCGRKNHRVMTESETLFTIPCEAIFNNHPRVFRSALVGVGPKGRQRPVIIIELEPGDNGRNKDVLTRELLDLAASNEKTRAIKTLLFHKSLPVDIRHNSKIFREKLAVWAEQRVA